MAKTHDQPAVPRSVSAPTYQYSYFLFIYISNHNLNQNWGQLLVKYCLTYSQLQLFSWAKVHMYWALAGIPNHDSCKSATKNKNNLIRSRVIMISTIIISGQPITSINKKMKTVWCAHKVKLIDEEDASGQSQWTTSTTKQLKQNSKNGCKLPMPMFWAECRAFTVGKGATSLTKGYLGSMPKLLYVLLYRTEWNWRRQVLVTHTPPGLLVLLVFLLKVEVSVFQFSSSSNWFDTHWTSNNCFDDRHTLSAAYVCSRWYVSYHDVDDQDRNDDRVGSYKRAHMSFDSRTNIEESYILSLADHTSSFVATIGATGHNLMDRTKSCPTTTRRSSAKFKTTGKSWVILGSLTDKPFRINASSIKSGFLITHLVLS